MREAESILAEHPEIARCRAARREAILSAIRQAQREAFEEAAKVAEESDGLCLDLTGVRPVQRPNVEGGHRAAAAIRALITEDRDNG